MPHATFRTEAGAAVYSRNAIERRPTILIDSREQRPLTFEGYPTLKWKLWAGDYSAIGLEHTMAFERKSLGDLLSSCGVERERFLDGPDSELVRIAALPYGGLVIEATKEDLQRGTSHSRIAPESVLGTLAAWHCRTKCPVIWAGSRAGAARWIVERLELGLRYLHEEE